MIFNHELNDLLFETVPVVALTRILIDDALSNMDADAPTSETGDSSRLTSTLNMERDLQLPSCDTSLGDRR